MSHKVIIITPPPGIAPPSEDDPQCTFSYSPNHDLPLTEQARIDRKIRRLIDKAIALAKGEA